MTFKQAAKARYFDLIAEYHAVKKNLSTPEAREKFVGLSVAIHAAKGEVPKRYWPLINKG
jgi:hypothetical protein